MSPASDIGARIKRCAVCKIDFKGRFVFVDDSVEQLLGLSKEDLFGKSFLDFVEESEQPTVAHVLYQRNHYETFFESIRLRLVDRGGRQIPVTIVISLNFIGGSPVNFQIIIDVEDGITLNATAVSGDLTFQEFAARLNDIDPVDYCDQAIELVHRYAGVRRCVIYALHDNVIEPLRFDADRIGPLADLHSYEALLQWVAQSGEEYFFLDHNAVQRAIEKTASAPNEFIARFELNPSRAVLFRVAFEESTDPLVIQAAIDEIKSSIRLACRLAPQVSAEAHDEAQPISGSTALQLLAETGVYCCLTSADGTIRTMSPKWDDLLGLGLPVERYGDLVLALSAFNGPEPMQRLVDIVGISHETKKDIRFDEVVNISRGRHARLVAARQVRTVADQCICLVLIPLSQHDAARYDGSIDNASLRNILLELQSTVLASASISERLAHEFYNELDRDGNYYLTTLGEKNRKLNGMLTSLLTSLQIVDENEPPQTTDLALMVDALTADLRAAYPGLAFAVKHSELPKIFVRSRKLATALRNILINSLKYSRQSGVEISIQAALANDFCSISISDNGPGISPRFLPQVQEFYYRAPDKHTQSVDGLGCGLAIVRQIMKSLGGRLTVASEPERGTTVTLVFPVTSVESANS